jgi:hypothetical protein
MVVNYYVLGAALTIIVLVLLVIIRRNHKEKKRLTKMLNEDYPKDPLLDSDANDDMLT